MPKPQADETKDEFMNRCIPVLVDEGKDQDEAVSVCSSLWENKDDEEDE